jgi:hypothetical protein
VAVNPFVFVVGCPRSGTTLLQRLLDAHPSLAVIDETLWIPAYAKRARRLRSAGLAITELLPDLLAERRFARLGLDPGAVEGLLRDGRGPYREFVTRVFDLYGERHGKPFVGDKSPGYIRSIRTLHDLFPEARFVHLIRDGRDVAISATRWAKAERVFRDYPTWPHEPVTTAALWWERNVRLGREAAEQLPDGWYHELRYEDLVERPAERCAGLCSFLGLAPADEMLRFHEGKTKRMEGVPSKRQWLPPTPGLRDWRREMEPADVELFEAVAGDLLETLGYERGRPRPAARRRADRARSAVSAHTLERGRPLPRAWQ